MLRLLETNLGSATAAFADPADLFVRRLTERENRFLEFGRRSIDRARIRRCYRNRRGAALQLDVCKAHGKASVLRIISEKPIFQALIHDRSGDREMQCRHATVGERLWI